MMKLLMAQARVKRGLSIRELAKRAGISKSHVERIEAGESSRSLGAMCWIAKVLETPITELFIFDA